MSTTPAPVQRQVAGTAATETEPANKATHDGGLQTPSDGRAGGATAGGATAGGATEDPSPRAQRLFARLGGTSLALSRASQQRFERALDVLAETIADDGERSADRESQNYHIVEEDYEFILTAVIDDRAGTVGYALHFRDDSGEFSYTAEHRPYPDPAASREYQRALPPPNVLVRTLLTDDDPSTELVPAVEINLEVPQASSLGEPSATSAPRSRSTTAPASTGPSVTAQPSGAAQTAADAATRDESDPEREAITAELANIDRELAALDRELVIAIADGVLDAAGIVDPTPISDGIATVRDLSRGDWIGASLSIVSIVPYLGDAIAKPLKGTRLAKRVSRVHAAISRLNKQRAKLSERIRRHLPGSKGAPSPQHAPPAPETTGGLDDAILDKHHRDVSAHQDTYQQRVENPGEKTTRQQAADKGRVTEAVGERAAAEYMAKHYPNHRMERGFSVGSGYDQVWVKDGPGGIFDEIVIVEAKGNRPDLSFTQTMGQQMSKEWVEAHAINMSSSSDPAVKRLGRTIYKAILNGPPPKVVGEVISAKSGAMPKSKIPDQGLYNPER